MIKILVQLPANRDYAGTLEVQTAAGKRIAGPFHVCGRANDESAQKNRNPGRDPLLPFGDLPFGEYQIVKIMATGDGTSYPVDEFGSAGIVLMRPKSGDAALADANGRFGFFIQGGVRSSRRLLRPTVDGSLRLSDSDQRRFIQALGKAGEDQSFCLVVCTAKAGAKVAVAKTERARRNTPATLLLASSVAASTITGTIRQIVAQTVTRAAGVSFAAAGLAFVAEPHAAAQDGSAYGPTSGSSGAENTPSDNQTTPADNQSTPSDNQSMPADNQSAPADNQTTPADNQSTPSDNQSMPADNQAAPADSQTTPVNDQTAPSDNQSAPADTSNAGIAAPAPPATAIEQLQQVQETSDEATRAQTDEEAHDKASDGFDTPSTVAPAVNLQNPEGTVAPDAASGDMAPASEAGSAPGSPITLPGPSTESAPVGAPEDQTGDADVQAQALPAEPASQLAAPADQTADQPSSSSSSISSTLGKAAIGAAAAAALMPILSSPSVSPPSQPAPITASQEPGAQAATGQDIQNLAAPQPTVNGEAPAVDMSGKKGVVNPYTASGDMQQAGQAGMAPGLPVSDPRVAAALWLDKNSAKDYLGAQSQCAARVEQAINLAGGIKVKPISIMTPGKISASYLGASLTDAGFTVVPNNTPLQPGDVAVVQPAPGHPDGHAAMWDGHQWVSDYQQGTSPQPALPYPAQIYRDSKTPYTIYRWPQK